MRNGDLDDERAHSIQSAIVRAGRTADTIQAIHDVVEAESNALLQLTKDEEDVLLKVNKDIENLKGLLELVRRGGKVEEFAILKKSCVEIVQHRLLRSLQEANFVRRREFPAVLPILYAFVDHCQDVTGVKGPLMQHLKAETNRYLSKFHEERRQRLTYGPQNNQHKYTSTYYI